MRKLFKVVFLFIESLIIYILLGFTLTAIAKNIQSSIMVEVFKSKGVYQEDISTETEKYFLVSSNEELGYLEVNSIKYPGNTSDILVSRKFMEAGPIVNGLCTFFVGGHASFCLDEYYDYELSKKILPDIDMNIEAAGTDIDSQKVEIWDKSDWLSKRMFNEVIGLRVKLTDDEKKEIQSVMCSNVGDRYNFSFLFNTDKTSYCSDVISKGFNEIGKNLNKDGFVTTIHDLIVSKDTYISYYHYYLDDVRYIYYIG